ncbi:hypothetical protein Taro_050961 [Colocasia esculenta]|uniref:Uncharacterized protein n=1 Tax=Colocasia esculenta TaxID=4460 RepID=A0A843XER3_COLES|nr:hypothetical protein [Colocasia esculenta]
MRFMALSRYAPYVVTDNTIVTSMAFRLSIVWGLIGLVATEVPSTTVIPVATAFGVAFLSRPVNGSRLLSAFWSSDACQSRRRGRLTCRVVTAPREGGEAPPLSSPTVGARGGVAAARAERERRRGSEEEVASSSVWGTPRCGILAVGLPADVATAERVATSDKASPRSDATLSWRGVAVAARSIIMTRVSRSGFLS